MTDFNQLFQQFAQEKNLSPDHAQKQVVTLLAKMGDELQKPVKKSWFGLGNIHAIKGLYIWGGVGRGKTMIMDLFFEWLPIQAKRRVHFNIFMLDVHNSIKLLREEGKGRDPLIHIAKDIAQDCRVLCFDEFQVYDIADAMVLSELFKALFDEGVSVIATSNVAPEDLYKDGLQRARFEPFIPLVKQSMEVFYLDSDQDYRQQALCRDGVYFVRDEDAMMSLFEKLTFPDDAAPCVLDVEGRTLHALHATKTVAWFDFAQLCERPCGARDYQVISNYFDTVFINHVPRMGYDRRNEAKRFIVLVDTLYDAGVHLVLNAEISLMDLYHGDDHAFEFERTVSRLREMQGEAYLSKTKKENKGRIGGS